MWSTALLRHPVLLSKGHHCCVVGNLCAVEDGQPIDHDLQSPGIINGVAASMSRFLTMTFADTQPPPSLHTCAAARSSGNPLDPKNPAFAWWPRQSRRRPHRQVREEKGMGRRHHNTLKGCGSMRVDRVVNAIKTLLAPSTIYTKTGFVMLGQTILATRPHGKRAVSAIRAGLKWVVVVFVLGRRKPANTASHVGTSNCASQRVRTFPYSFDSPSLLPRPGVFASRSGCSQPNWPNARPLHCLLPTTT